MQMLSISRRSSSVLGVLALGLLASACGSSKGTTGGTTSSGTGGATGTGGTSSTSSSTTATSSGTGGATGTGGKSTTSGTGGAPSTSSGTGGATSGACSPDPCVHSTTGCMATGATGYTCGTCTAGWMGTDCDMPVSCTGAAAPANGTVSAAGATFGNAVTYACDAGYTLAGTAMATCQASGTFATPAPTCTPNPCSPNLVAPANGTVSMTMGTTGTVATYGCNAGYTLAGTATQTCQATGTWSGAAPTCTLVTTGCTPNPCLHSMTGCTTVGGTGYSCGTCVPGWTGANCDMPVTCSGATAPANGMVSAASATFGNTVTYSCNTGYTLTGTAMATCQASGTFTGPAPTCAAVSCGAPPQVANAGAPVVSGGDGGGATDTYGATAAYTCTAGFTKNGANPTCGGTGTWGAAPTCTAASCGTYTDVVYHTTGTFVVSQTPFGAGNGTFAGMTTHASTPVFTGAGDTTPFTVTPFTNGMVRLRFTNDATGNPIAGPVNLVEWYFPLEFKQTTNVLGVMLTLTANVDHSVGLVTAGLANCGAGDAACTNYKPTLTRKCADNATGTLAGMTLTWGACAPAPTMQTSWNFVSARADTGAGCATGYNAWGNVTCTGGGCGNVNANGLGDSFQTWNQAMANLTFSSTTYKTATFTMPAMEIPNATTQSVTTLAITSSTVVGTQCGSTPGTDLVCNIE